MLNQQHTDWRASGTQFSHLGGGNWHSILTPRGATGTGARDKRATGMTLLSLYTKVRSELFTNYRPISNLPCLLKILEHPMDNRLHNFLAEHRIISKRKQYGFRENYSTYIWH